MKKLHLIDKTVKRTFESDPPRAWTVCGRSVPIRYVVDAGGDCSNCLTVKAMRDEKAGKEKADGIR